MTKEEQIREIIIEIHPCYIYQDDPSPREIAKQIYESGYRKADEVRKETAREVISWILNHIDVYAYFDQIMNFFAEKYDNDGVKVVEDERK